MGLNELPNLHDSSQTSKNSSEKTQETFFHNDTTLLMHVCSIIAENTLVFSFQRIAHAWNWEVHEDVDAMRWKYILQFKEVLEMGKVQLLQQYQKRNLIGLLAGAPYHKLLDYPRYHLFSWLHLDCEPVRILGWLKRQQAPSWCFLQQLGPFEEVFFLTQP